RTSRQCRYRTGCCPSPSATGVTRLTNPTASTQFLNLNDLISFWSSSTCQPSSCSSRGAIWSCVSGGVPPLHGTHLLSARLVDAMARILLDRLHLVDDGFLRWVGPALEPGIADLARDGLRGGAQAHH